MTNALEQAVEVVLRFKEDPGLLDPTDEESYLVRVPREVRGNLVWQEEVVRVPPVEPEPIPIVMDVEVLEWMKQLPWGEHTVEVEFSVFPAPIQDKGARPYLPHMLLMVESESGMILGSELLAPEPGLVEMWGTVPMKVVHQLARMGILPREIKVRSTQFLELLKLLEEELGVKVKAAPRLPSLDRAKEALQRRFV